MEHSALRYSAAAAAGGAARTVSVDCDRMWLAYLDHSLAANDVENPAREVGRKHDAIYGDCFEWLKRLAKRGETFDAGAVWNVRLGARRGHVTQVVILDPPSTSTVNKKRWSAARDYGALAALAAPLVAPGGRLFCTTNARKLKPRAFAQTCGRALREHAAQTPGLRDVVLERVVPPAVDFPTLAGAPAEVKNLVFRFVGE